MPLPGTGTLALNSVAVVAGQFVSAVDIAANKLVYTPPADLNGNGLASFTFQVQDDGGTSGGGVDLDQSPNTITVDVTAVNDEPAGTDKTITTNEDTDFTFATTDFGFTDPLDGNLLLAVKITSLPLPGTGTLTLNSIAVVAGQFVSAVDIAANKLVYTPPGNLNGNGLATFTFQVQDDGGTANGGVDLDQSANTITVDVTAVNDAPVIIPAATPVLSDVLEDAGAPVGSVGTLISSLVDLPGGGGLDNVTDDDAGAVTGIAVTAADTANGIWHFSIDDGANWNPLSAVNPNSAQLLAADSNTRVYFQPNSDFSGTASPAITFRAWDQTTGVNGGTGDTTPPGGSSAFSAPQDTADITVNPVNDEPAGTDKTITTDEDTDFTFATTDFGFTDPVESDALLAVKITSLPLPGTGTLTLNSIAVVAGQFVSAIDIAANKLVYTPPADLNGNGLATFTFQVQDDGGTANGGIDLDQSANSITIDVTALNDAPEGTDKTITTDEDTDFTFATTDFGFTDPVESDALLAVKITSLPLPGTGTLTLNSIAVVAGQFVSAIDIAANKLVYTPPADLNGNGLATFTFQVQDDGGTANGGIDLDQTPNTITVDVTPVNDEPAGTDKTIATLEDTDFTFATTDFGFTDPLDSNALLAVKITSLPLPGTGTLTLNSIAVVAGQFVSAIDIAANKLVYTPPGDLNGNGLVTFTFQVQDDGGTANGGIDLDQSANTITIDVTAVNDRPVVTTPGPPIVYAVLDPATQLDPLASAIDIDSPDLDAGTLTVSLSATATVDDELSILPGGNVTLVGFDVVVSGTTIGSFSGGTAGSDLVITWNPNSTPSTVEEVLRQIAFQNLSGTPDLSTRIVDFILTDGDGGTSDAAQQQVNFAGGTTPPVLSAPSLPASYLENGPPVSIDALATVIDVDSPDLDGGGLTISITNSTANDNLTVVAGGNVTLNGFDVEVSGTAIGTFSGGVAGSDLVITWNINSTPSTVEEAVRQISFSNVSEDPDTTTRTVELTLTDGDGGTSLTIQQQVNVLAVNDEPLGTDKTITTDEDTDFTFATTDFGFTDPVESDALLAVKITSLPLPGTGTLTLNSIAVVAGQFVSAIDIAANKLVYTPPADLNGNGLATFTFQVQDDGGTANGGIDLDQSANSITIDVTALNDAPEGTDKTITTDEDTDFTFATTDFGFTDPVESDALLAVKITSLPLPGTGTLTLNSIAVVAGQFVSAIDIAANKLVYTPPADLNGNGLATFTFQVQDDGGTANGGIDLDQTPNTITVDVTPVNDEPAGTDKTIATLEDTDFTFATTDFGFTDPLDSNALLAVKITSLPLPGTGTLTLNSIAVVAGQFVSAIDIAANKLVYTPPGDLNGNGLVTFTFQVQDDGGTANGGIDLDQSANTITIDVTAVNDEPAGADKTINTNEDTDFTFATTDFGFTDPLDSNVLLAVKITSLPLPGTGTLTLNSIAVVAGQFVSAVDIAANKLVYTPPGDLNGNGLATFTFQVQDDGGTANGGIDLDQSANTITVDVTALNDEPEGTDKTITTDEDTEFTFATTDFGFTDPVESDALLAVKIASLPLPGTGTLTLNSIAVVANQFVSAIDIAANKLVYTPPGDLNGNGLTSFTFQVQDDGGIPNGGLDLDQTPNTITVDVTPVNDEPAGSDRTLTTGEDINLIFAAADFGFTDPLDGDSLLEVEIASLPLPGTGILTLNSIAVVAGQFVSVTDITANKLIYAPPAATIGTNLASFTFQVKDDGGTASGGIDLDSTPNTITLDVEAIAAPPPPPPPPPPIDPPPPVEEPEPEEETETSQTPEVPEGVPPPETSGTVAVASTTSTPIFTNVITPAVDEVTGDATRDGDRIEVRRVAPTDSTTTQPILEKIIDQLIDIPETIEEAVIERIEDRISGIEEDNFLKALDQARETASEPAVITQVVLGTSTAATTALSVGYIAWLARGGLLLSSFLSSMPAWRLIDPVPVLAYLDSEEREEEGESLDSLVNHQATQNEASSEAGVPQAKVRSTTVEPGTTESTETFNET